jgi:hypothetical protein
MIIDDEKNYLDFLADYGTHDLLINVLGSDDRYHPKLDNLCAIFIRSITNGRDIVVSINHPDSTFQVSKNRLCNDLNKMLGKKWTFDKKKTLHYIKLTNLYDVHILDFLESGKIKDISKYQLPTHTFYFRQYKNYSDLNCVIPLTIHSKWFEDVADTVTLKLKTTIVDDVFIKLNDSMNHFYMLEKNGIKIDKDIFNSFFENKELKFKPEYTDTVYTEYNLFTSTGRPSNRFGGINYAALKKDDGCRSSFISRYGNDGYLYMIDYSAYHPHLIAKLVNYNLPADAYTYLGKYYYNKQELSSDELKASKITTFQLIYGNIPDKYTNIPFFNKIIYYINHRWKYFLQYGYIETPIFKRRITANNIQDPSPNKLFNYILQASETEYNIKVLENLNSYLHDKWTMPILYTFDSILFDVHVSEESFILNELKRIMTLEKFPVKCYKGINYNEMSVISIE